MVHHQAVVQEITPQEINPATHKPALPKHQAIQEIKAVILTQGIMQITQEVNRATPEVIQVTQ